MPAFNYVSQSPTSISVNYADMPAKAEAAFVNKEAGAKTVSPSTALSKGGIGSAAIAILPNLPAGQYYLLAQDHATQQYIAQTPFPRSASIHSGYQHGGYFCIASLGRAARCGGKCD